MTGGQDESSPIADLARSIAARKGAPATSAVVICRDGSKMAALARALSFFAPEIEILQFPAWDCLPYDRVSPNHEIVARRWSGVLPVGRMDIRNQPRVVRVHRADQDGL